MKRFIFLILSCFFLSFVTTEEPKLRFFNLDLHIAVIADVKNIFESFGHEVVDWNLSGHAWVFGKSRTVVDVVNENTWHGLDKEMCDRFYERYKDFLNQFDGFIVTYSPAFALLYEKFNKPIIIVNASRYELPFTWNPEKWQWLNDYLKEGVKNNKIFIVSNNKGDGNYLHYYTGIESEVIPSLCLYTNSKYQGISKKFQCHSRWTGHASAFNKIWESILKKTGLFAALPQRYSWQDLYNLKGIVHLPYQISTMSIFEQYSANVPLFLPTKAFLFKLHKLYPRNILNELSYFGNIDSIPKTLSQDDLNNVLNDTIVKRWIEWADYYDTENMPHIQYFDSFKDLIKLLRTVNCKEVSQKMKEYNKTRQAIAFKKWKAILEKVYEAHNRQNTPPESLQNLYGI